MCVNVQWIIVKKKTKKKKTQFGLDALKHSSTNK